MKKSKFVTRGEHKVPVECAPLISREVWRDKTRLWPREE
jgi:hypothetical protein